MRLLSLVPGLLGLLVAAPAIAQSPACPTAVLARLERHAFAPGETVESIAARYGLYPDTLLRLNPELLRGTPAPGTVVQVPPFNGVVVDVPPGATWSDLEAAYGVRADVLFELNGCTPRPDVVFVPGVNWSPATRSPDFTGFATYPLPTSAEVALGFGPLTDGFHSGVDLLADPGTPVRAVAGGVVAFAGSDPTYGNLAIVNHPGDRQTRYAHLDNLAVSTGQPVAAAQQLGTVGRTGRPDLAAPHLHFEVRTSTPQGWVAQDPEVHFATEAIAPPAADLTAPTVPPALDIRPGEAAE